MQNFYVFINKFIIPIFIPFVWAIAKIDQKLFFLKRRKKILLIAQNQVAANHIKYIWKLLKEDVSLEFYLSDERVIKKRVSKSELKNIGNIPIINIIYALFRFWDLVIFVNHPGQFGIWFSPNINKIYINHGMWVGKINNEFHQDGVYGACKVLRPYGSLFYNKMFATSHYEKQQAEKCTPELKNKISVTGYHRADQLYRLNKEERDNIRKKLGFSKHDIVIHVMSTWGSSSLYQTIGDSLLDHAIRLSDKYKFIFSLHPRHDEFGDIKGRRRDEILNKYSKLGIIIADTLDWEEYIISSDICISDHTSLCLYSVIINKPLILVPVNLNSYIRGSAFDELQKLAVSLEHPNELENAIYTALNIKTLDHYSEFISKFWCYQGCANLRYKNEIYKILQYTA